MPRGGARNGKVGQSYSNRSDLNAPKALPITAVPGQAYGEAGKQIASQQITPMASAPISSAPTTAQKPSTPPDLFAETSRPNESLMTGVGDGLIAPEPNPDGNDENFNTAITAYMPVLSFIAAQPDTSPETRAIIRALRPY